MKSIDFSFFINLDIFSLWKMCVSAHSFIEKLNITEKRSEIQFLLYSFLKGILKTKQDFELENVVSECFTLKKQHAISFLHNLTKKPHKGLRL